MLLLAAAAAATAAGRLTPLDSAFGCEWGAVIAVGAGQVRARPTRHAPNGERSGNPIVRPLAQL